MEKNVADIVDKLLDVIKYEINRMKEMGEDTSVLENQLMDFRRDQRNLIDWMMNNDEASIKLYLSRLLEFSKTVHMYYNNVKSGKHIADMISDVGRKQIEEEKKQTQDMLSGTIDLITNDDALLDEEFSFDEPKQEESKARIMDTSTPVDDEVKDVENMIAAERKVVEAMKARGEDTLDLEFLISQQESLLISMKEALLNGDYEEASRLKDQIEELGRRFK